MNQFGEDVQPEVFETIVLVDGKKISATFVYWEIDPEDSDVAKLALKYEDIELVARSIHGPFHAMSKIRLQLEAQGARVACYGSRENVFPSAMGAESNLAFKVTIGKVARMADLVDIFETDPEMTPATVEQQEDFRQRWHESLNRDDGDIAREES